MQSSDEEQDQARRGELAAFLKAMRARIHPEEAGLAPGKRRRVQGLRREEVASLAAISTTWYVWLEQGREVKPSLRVLESLARVLRLNRIERAHLFRLALPSQQLELHRSGKKTPSLALCQLVEGLHPHPAYVLDPLWDVVVWNHPAERLLGDFDGAERWSRNVLMRIFLDDAWRSLFEGWEALSHSAVAQFRASTTSLRHYPDCKEIIETLEACSPEFSSLWQTMELANSKSWQKTLCHPGVGRMTFISSTLACDGADPGFWLSIYVPAETSDRERLQRLIGAQSTD